MTTRKEYFRTQESYFWQWEEGGNVVSIPNGSTIAYKEVLVEIIQAIEFQGLPYFGSLVLALAATNVNGSEAIEQAYARFPEPFKDREYVLEALDFLKVLGKLPPQYKKKNGRVLLFKAIFENSHGKLSIQDSARIATVLRNAPETIGRDETHIPFNTKIFSNELRQLSIIGRRFPSPEKILEAIASLPYIPDLEEIPGEPTPEETGDLVDQLMERNQTFQVGALIRYLWGGLSIPAHSSAPSNQPLGGIADLTNKGDFDKLLVSEFANDDLVFLSRLANNEALYVQREIPPHHNETERLILIDVSLRNWGTPRTMAFAIATAISSHPKTDIPCRCFVIGKGYKEVSVQTVDAVIEALEELEPQPDAASGIRDFLENYPQKGKKEVFVITEESTIKRAAMLRTVNEYHQAVDYWIYTSSEGDISVYKRQQHSKRLLQHLKLPLVELWTRKTPGKRSKTPMQLFQGHYPILFMTPQTREVIPSSDGQKCFLLSKNQMLFRYHRELNPNVPAETIIKGWELVHNNIPFRGDAAVGINSRGDSVFALYNYDMNKGYLLNTISGEEKTFFFDKNSTKHGQLGFKNGKFVFANYGTTWYIDPTSAEVSTQSGLVEGNFEVDPATGVVKQVNKADEVSIYQLTNERSALLQKMPKFSDSRTILKNISAVFVNEAGNLVFNKHEFTCTTAGNFKLSHRRVMKERISAHRQSDQEFIFTDGSSIEVNPAGMLILKSSNPELPFVFIPTTLETSLGVATEGTFSGNPFYQRGYGNVIPAKQFYEQHVQPFITTILTYGTSS